MLSSALPLQPARQFDSHEPEATWLDVVAFVLEHKFCWKPGLVGLSADQKEDVWTIAHE